MGWVFNATPRPHYPRERPGTQRTRGWVDLVARLDGCGKLLLPPGFDPPDRPARIKSLYRLSYPGATNVVNELWLQSYGRVSVFVRFRQPPKANLACVCIWTDRMFSAARIRVYVSFTKRVPIIRTTDYSPRWLALLQHAYKHGKQISHSRPGTSPFFAHLTQK